MRRTDRWQRPARLGALAATFAISLGGIVQSAIGQDGPPKRSESTVKYSPFAAQKFPSRVFWGVADVHTGYSFDSGLFGITLRTYP